VMYFLWALLFSPFVVHCEPYSTILSTIYQTLVWNNTIADPITVGTGPDNTSLLLSFFESNVVGRNWPLGTYDTFNEVKLFFYASATQYTKCLSTTITDLVVNKIAMTAWVRITLIFQYDYGSLNSIFGALRGNNGNPYVTDQFGRFTFSPNNKILSFDLITPNLGLLFDPIYTTPSLLSLNIYLLCSAQSQICTGSNQVFADQTTCTDYYTNATGNGSLPIGSWDRANEDSFVCRINSLGFVSKNALYCNWLEPISARCTNRTVDMWTAETPTYFPSVLITPTLCQNCSAPLTCNSQNMQLSWINIFAFIFFSLYYKQLYLIHFNIPK